MSGLTCPKCRGDMRSYERSGVTIDQCTECRGIFLDRGELERLVDAEAAFHEGRAAGAAAAPPRFQETRPYGDGGRRDDYRREGRRPESFSDDDYRHGHYGKRKKSFLNQLFD